MKRLSLLVLLSLSIAGCGGTRGHYKPIADRSASQPASYAEGGASASDSHVGTSIRPEPAPDRPGLGTKFGEERVSRVQHTAFERASASPAALLALHYNNASGVEAALDYNRAELGTARGYMGGGNVAVTITDAHGRPLAGGAAGGRVYVVGRDGDRYNIQIRNDTAARLEIVASVDGLDVIDGLGATPEKRGYIVRPYSTLMIDGFRTSDSTVAAFRFGAVRDSYAARTGGDRNVGVIGIAVYNERGSEWTVGEIRRRDTADPFPGYAKPPGIAR